MTDLGINEISFSKNYHTFFFVLCRSDLSAKMCAKLSETVMMKKNTLPKGKRKARQKNDRRVL